MVVCLQEGSCGSVCLQEGSCGSVSSGGVVW